MITPFDKQKLFIVKDQFLSNPDDYKDLKIQEGAKTYNLESYKWLCPRKLWQIVLLTSH